MAQRYGQMPDEIATRPWSKLITWLQWSGLMQEDEGSE